VNTCIRRWKGRRFVGERVEEMMDCCCVFDENSNTKMVGIVYIVISNGSMQITINISSPFHNSLRFKDISQPSVTKATA
jgi:hypothetical protein